MFVRDKTFVRDKRASFTIVVFKIASVEHVPTEVWPSGKVVRRLMKKNGTDGTLLDTAQSGKAPNQDSYFSGKYNLVGFVGLKKKTFPSHSQ